MQQNSLNHYLSNICCIDGLITYFLLFFLYLGELPLGEKDFDYTFMKISNGKILLELILIVTYFADLVRNNAARDFKCAIVL